MSVVDIRHLREERVQDAFDSALKCGDYRQALTLAKGRLDERRARFGDAHVDVVDALADVALTLSLAGDLVAAAEVSLEALSLEEHLYGPEHARVGDALCRLGHLQLAAHNTADALTLFQRACEVLNAVDEKDARLAVACSGLAAAYTRLGEFPGAVSALERALQCYALALGPENSDMLMPLKSLADLQEARGAVSEALNLRERAVRIAKRRSEINSVPYTLALARLCISLGHTERARALCEEALQTTNSIERAEAHALFAELFERLRDFPRAQAHYQHALETYRAALPASHPQIAVALMNVATLTAALGDSARAKPLAHEALNLFLSALGPTHPHTQQMRAGLRQAFLDCGEATIAAEFAFTA